MDIDYVAKLARVELNETEKLKFAKQLPKILEYIQKLNEVQTENVEPTCRVYRGAITYRGDKVKPFSSSSILKHAPKSKNGFFIVPPVIE
ncbi:MAG: Asp-tRNA(Asn)/Glu-tRNA(Gln) amidotransferase subunit GatC [Chlamydiota bacterium]|nr:Asp-tRNA(Asn)/Glu-tRNA(Gln) amidotransferase subunit GatC [Chlamydiota bacterium]